jgi:hypothetical protein
MRKKALTDHEIPSIMPGEMSSKQFRRNWARLIQKIYEVDPLTCPGCKGKMRLISFIDKPVLIKKILHIPSFRNTDGRDASAYKM